MDSNSFAQLEERINKAIERIDKLTTKNKNLEEENRTLQSKVESLQKELKKRNETVSVLDQDRMNISEKIRDKIESLLEKIDGYDKNRL